jgi:hypothetical protein
MAHKNSLLAEQFQRFADGLADSVTGPLAAGKDLFRGISIHVNGFTRPSNLVSGCHKPSEQHLAMSCRNKP